jgi:hypothetical protein
MRLPVLTAWCVVQLGFAMLEVGSVRVFHMQNILIKVCTPPHAFLPCIYMYIYIYIYMLRSSEGIAITLCCWGHGPRTSADVAMSGVFIINSA